MPSSKFTYKLRASDSGAPVTTPQWAFLNRTGAANVDTASAQQCVVQFDIPADIQPPVLLYYKLTNFYQNHRRYVKSLNQDQLRGDFVSASTLSSGDCKPLGSNNGKAVYPCGLIANSLFNGEFSIVQSSTVAHKLRCGRHVFEPHVDYGLIHQLHVVRDRHRVAGRVEEIRCHTDV